MTKSITRIKHLDPQGEDAERWQKLVEWVKENPLNPFYPNQWARLLIDKIEELKK